MFEQMSNQVLSFSKQFAESMIKTNAVVVEHFEKVMDVQMKNVEDRMHVMADFVEASASVKSPEDFRTIAPKTLQLIKTNAEKNFAFGQEIGTIVSRTAEQLVSLSKGQFEVANEAIKPVVKANKR